MGSEDMLYDLPVLSADITAITENECGLMMLTESAWMTKTDGGRLLLCYRNEMTNVGRDKRWSQF